MLIFCGPSTTIHVVDPAAQRGGINSPSHVQRYRSQGTRKRVQLSVACTCHSKTDGFVFSWFFFSCVNNQGSHLLMSTH